MSKKLPRIEQWVDESTGERHEVQVIEKDIDSRDGGFMVTYLAEIINMIDTLGNKKMQVVKYILQNMDKNTNLLLSSNRAIAKNSGVSYRIVFETLKLLDEAGIIERKLGVIMLSPRICNNWKAGKEKYMLVKFNNFNKEVNNDEA